MTSSLNVVTSSRHSFVKNFMTFFVFFLFFYKNAIKLQILELSYVFEGKESNGDNRKELTSIVDLKNPDQVPVKEVFEGILLIVS